MFAARLALPVALLVTTLGVTAARGETFKLTERDGTLHFTNAPTDPRYRKMAASSGTAAGWLRLPRAESGR